jgi:putative Ca2+/H+ antiporter (TMEM165/GDT1 family)
MQEPTMTMPWSRTLVTFHGVAATLFLTIVAGLVGRWSSSPTEKKAVQ